jgi:uncharacterized cupin superfamily protein
MKLLTLPLTLLAAILCVDAAAAEPSDTSILLRPARVFDGNTLHEGWRVLVKGASLPWVPMWLCQRGRARWRSPTKHCCPA